MKTARILAFLGAIGLPAAASAQDTLRPEHVVVQASGLGRPYAEAIARTVSAARAIAVEQFAFDMPEVITVTATLNPSGSVRLFNDGRDHFSLTVRSEADLRKPSESGIFHIYGLCHELGHLAMYRSIADHSWMTTAAAEGWAHYLGSRLVDAVYAKEGPELWPDRYDYLEDGTRRLQRQLAAGRASDVDQGAGLWQQLVDILGDRRVAPLFAAWGKAQVDPADPGKALGETLLRASSDKRLADWWQHAQKTFLVKRARSVLASRTAKPVQPVGRPRELAEDDGQPAGKKSLAGSGHAVRLTAPGDTWCITGVAIHGSRYGTPAPPQESFHVWLCDAEFKAIADFPFPYASFPYGAPQWVRLAVKPTLVPRTFYLCAGFNPTATKGVFLSHDAAGSGTSASGLPGAAPEPFFQGDWLIRAAISNTKGAKARD